MRHLTNPTTPLLNTEFTYLARNTIDYWMARPTESLTEKDAVGAIESAPVNGSTTLQLYIHIPFCAQTCSFCAFSGGNSLSFAAAEEYISLLVTQMKRVLPLIPAYGSKPIRSIHIGGGSPDLVAGHIETLLDYLISLKGFDDNTELAIECALSTVKADFLNAIIKFPVTKISYGLQVLDPKLRRHLHMPSNYEKKQNYLIDMVSAKVPIINADLITGLPGQTLDHVNNDLYALINHPAINAISSYLLTPGAAPALVADVQSENVPAVPSQVEQARMRLHTYSTLQANGWVRRGTNTYIDPQAVDPVELNKVSGHECIGGRMYDSFLVGFGAQAISSIPGIRLENIVDINRWKQNIDAGGIGINLRHSTIAHQYDMALWTFPLFYDGLPECVYRDLIENNRLSVKQIERFESFIRDGLIVQWGKYYRLSIIGETFMGHIVRELKSDEGKVILDEYIDEGYQLAEAVNSGVIDRSNSLNDRQQAEAWLSQRGS